MLLATEELVTLYAWQLMHIKLMQGECNRGDLSVPVLLLHLVLDLTLCPGTWSTECLTEDGVIQLFHLTLQLSVSGLCLRQLGF